MKVRNTLLLLVVLALMLAALGGLISVQRSADRSAHNTEILKCLANADQQFRRDITDLLQAGRDPTKYGPLIARMKAEAQINYAQLERGQCPKPEAP